MKLSEHLAQPKVTAVGIAAKLGVSHSTVIRWAARRVPAERVRSVSEVTGIPPHELRPDVFPAPSPQVAA